MTLSSYSSPIDFFMIKAWAPLVRGYRFNHPVVLGLTQKYNKQPAQVLLRYSIQKVCYFVVSDNRPECLSNISN